MKKIVAVGFVAFLLPLLAASAQQTGGDNNRRGEPNWQQRQAMEQRLQARIDSIVRVRLSLSDEQFVRMQEVATKIERGRRMLRMDEGRLRVELRRVLSSNSIDESKVAELLDRMPALEKRRLELMEREQGELAKFLTPSQRARYIALQEELRRNMQDMQRRRLGFDGQDGPNRGNPPFPQKHL